MPFRFKYFNVCDEQSTQRVGTDSMILGAWSEPHDSGHILDIGTGCGILSLMMAQKSIGSIDAIEIDTASAIEARNNFQQSLWSERIHLYNMSIQRFIKSIDGKYDFIITNPPYFSDSLQSPVYQRTIARHDQVLSLHELATMAARVLTPQGILALIVPFTCAETFRSICEKNNLHLKRSLIVKSTPSKIPIRVAQEYSNNVVELPHQAHLIIRDRRGCYSAEYLKLTGEFHYF